MTSTNNVPAKAPKASKASKSKAPVPAVVTSAPAPAPVERLELNRIYMVPPSALRFEEGYNVSGRTLDLSPPTVKNADNFKPDDHFLRSVAKGLNTPITVWQDDDGSLFVIEGHRRKAALDVLADYSLPVPDAVPVRLREGLEDYSARTADIFVSNSGKALTMPQKAQVARRLSDAGWKDVQIAAAAHCAPRYVAELLAYTHLPATMQAWAEAETVSGTLLLELTRQLDIGTVQTIVAKAISAAKAKAKHGEVIKVSRKNLHAIDNRIPKDARPSKNPPAPTPEPAADQPAADKAPAPVVTADMTPDQKANAIAKGAKLPGSGNKSPAPTPTPAPAPQSGGTTLKPIGNQLFTSDNGKVCTVTSKARAEALAKAWNASGMVLPA